jgi:hypothetical protein
LQQEHPAHQQHQHGSDGSSLASHGLLVRGIGEWRAGSCRRAATEGTGAGKRWLPVCRVSRRDGASVKGTRHENMTGRPPLHAAGHSDVLHWR